MAWTAPKTYNATDVLTAAEMNTYQRDNMLHLNSGGVFTPLTTPLTSTSWDGDAYSTTGKTLIDLSAVFGAPAGIKAIAVRLQARDSASSNTSNVMLVVSPNNTVLSFAVGAFPRGLPNDYGSTGSGICPCDANGDIYYQINASGAGTLDATIEIWGYWL